MGVKREVEGTITKGGKQRGIQEERENKEKNESNKKRMDRR